MRPVDNVYLILAKEIPDYKKYLYEGCLSRRQAQAIIDSMFGDKRKRKRYERKVRNAIQK